MFRFTIAFVLLAASAASCRKEAPSAMVPPSARLQAEQAAQFSVLGDSGGSSAPETSRGSFAASAVPAPASASLPEPRPSVAVAQKLIRTGSLEIEVPDFALRAATSASTAGFCMYGMTAAPGLKLAVSGTFTRMFGLRQLATWMICCDSPSTDVVEHDDETAPLTVSAERCSESARGSPSPEQEETPAESPRASKATEGSRRTGLF